jgi:hypothetical protein
MDLKRLSRVEVKDAAKGTVSAVFSTLNVIDKDGDVTVPGAFKDGADVVISAYGHQSWEGKLPVGTGRIKTTNAEAILDGQFFMDTQHGADTFRTVKALAEKGLGDWSYGFTIKDSEAGEFDGRKVRVLKALDVTEVSPVLVGAGVNTRTLEVKALVGNGSLAAGDAYASAIKPHASKSSRDRWRSLDAYSDLPEGDISLLRKAFAWVDPMRDPEAKSSYKGLHHASDGRANVRACMALIGEMILGRSDIPVKDQRAVWNHLAAHLDEDDIEAADLATTDGGLKLVQEFVVVLAANDSLIGRASDVMAMRSTKGKGMAPTTALLMEWHRDSMRDLSALVDTPNEDAAREFVRFVRDNMSEDKP